LESGGGPGSNSPQPKSSLSNHPEVNDLAEPANLRSLQAININSANQG